MAAAAVTFTTSVIETAKAVIAVSPTSKLMVRIIFINITYFPFQSEKFLKTSVHLFPHPFIFK